jgi:hypothetical protein
MRTTQTQGTESFEFRSAFQKNSGQRRSARLFGYALLSMLLGAFAQQCAFSAPQDDRTDSSAQRERAQAGGQQSQENGGAELDDPRARLEWRLKTRGIPTVASKQHLMQLWQAQSANMSSSPAAISAPSGPQWVPIGPTGADYEQNGPLTGFVRDSGRVRTILPHPTDPDTVYLLTAGGGLWVTNNFTASSSTWRPLTDFLVTTSGGSVAFGRTPSVLYLGLGDPFDVIGVGGVMEKSIDGGATWTNMVDLGTPFAVRDVKVDTSVGTSVVQDIVLVATDAGLYRSVDGGTTYLQVPLAGFFGLNVWSIVQTSAGWLANIKYCPLAVGACLLISADHGATWASMTNLGNVYTGAGRTSLAVGIPGDKIVYAFAENSYSSDQLDLFRSSNGGQDWTALNLNSKSPSNPNGTNPNMDLMQTQAWYNQMILVDPRDVARNTIYLGGRLSTAVSKDGGNTWRLLSTFFTDQADVTQTGLPYVHEDAHAAAISNVPGATPVLLFGNDGGLFVSSDDGTTWSSDKNNGLQTFLFYSLISTPGFPSAVMGGTQDNGTRVRKGNTTIYNQSLGGDGFGTGWSQANTNSSIATTQFNSYFTNITNQVPDIYENFLFPELPLINDRVFATAVESPAPTADPTGEVFFTSSLFQVYKTIDGGITWTVIGSVGAPTHTIPVGVYLVSTPHAVGVSPVDLGHVGVIASGPRVEITTDGGVTWTDRVLMPGFVDPSSLTWADNQTIYVPALKVGGPRVAKSSDGGVNWVRADAGLPDVPIDRVIVDPRDTTHNTLLAATDQGVFRSTDGGASWAPYGTGLPNAYVSDIYMPPDGSFLRVATYGRGIWELPFLSFVGATLTDDVASCDNDDGSLDNGESGHLTITLHNDGSNALSAITATVSSTNLNVSFPNGNVANFPPAAASANTSAAIVVKLSGATGIQQLNFHIAFTDPALSIPAPVTATASFRANYQEIANGSANDDIEAANSSWTVTGTTPSAPDIGTWQRRQIGPMEHRWAAIDSNGASDVSLVSPILQVGSGNFTMSFEMRYVFEFDLSLTAWFDGMVIEASSDGGATWTDIGASALPTYDHPLVGPGGNVLGGRQAYTGASVGYPNFVSVTISLGTQFAGKNVQIRFRVGTNYYIGRPGVEIRNITTTGLKNTPFTAVVASSGCLTPTSTSTSLTSTKNPSFFGDLVTFGATVAGGSTAATGTVTFKDGAVTIGTGALNGAGQTTFPTSTLSVGVHPITATYGGDSTHATSTSSAMQQMVSKALTATTLASSLTSALVGQSVTFTATVTSAGGTPGGTATFFDGATQLGTGTLSAQGTATFATSALAAGTHSITADYSGDSNFTVSVSVAVTETITAAAPAATTTVLVSSAASALSGASVTFTATTTSSTSGTPTGTVSFFDGTTVLGTGTLNGSAVATFTTSTLAVGTHSITAKYSGSATFASSTSAALTETITTVAPSATTTVLVSSVASASSGASVTFTATIMSSTSGTPTGTVTFLDGTITLGTGTSNSSSVATFATSTLSVGTHSITAKYSGSATFASSTSAALTETITAVAPTATTTILVSSAGSASSGAPVTFTATITSSTSGTPTGTVTFLDGTTTLGTGTLSSAAIATFTTSILTVGTHSITAKYSGNATFAASTSAALTETITAVAPAATTTVLVSSAASAPSGAPVTFTATVSSSTSGTPIGTVTFLDGATTLGNGTLNSAAVATFTTSILTVGTHSITAKYSGSATFASSASAALTQTIAKTPTTDVLVSSAASASSGIQVTFSATITSNNSGTPTGTVTFLDGTTTLGTGTLNGSAVATIATSTLMVGTHSITADYAGDSNFAASTSVAVTETITPAAPNATAATLISSAPSAASGTPVTFTVTITSSTSGTPTGTANFLDGTATIGSGTLNSGGLAIFTTSTLTAGTHSITAAYGGDSKFAASTSTALTQVILAPSFTVASTQSSVTVSAGDLANYPLMVTGKNNFSGTVTVSCTAGLPSGASCTTPSAAITASTTTSAAMLTINTAGRTTAVLLRFPEGHRAGFLAGWLLVSAIVLGILGLGVPRRRLRLGYALALLLVSCALWQGGCGSSVNSIPVNTTAGTPAGTYTVTLTGTSGTTQQTTSVTLVVQ